MSSYLQRDVAVLAIPECLRNVVAIAEDMHELLEGFSKAKQSRQQAKPVAQREDVLRCHTGAQNSKQQAEFILERDLPDVHLIFLLQFAGVAGEGVPTVADIA